MNTFTTGLLVHFLSISLLVGTFQRPLISKSFLSEATLAPAPLPIQTPSPSPTPADNLPIVITADQPNIWTLEQAHYLLAQMHRRNLDLKAASLTELDANDINGISIDALKTVLAASAEFDQSVGVNNKLLKDEKQYTAARRRQLLDRRTSLEEQSLTLTKQIAELKIKQVQTKDEEEKKQPQAEIDELMVVQAMVKEQITQTNDQLKALSESTDKFESVNADAPSANGASTYEGVFKDTAKKIIEQFNNGPKLNASLRLDNYLQMEYEILSKQLTLLRDEVGPGERLIFMEIPQSINASYSRANGKWAQSWWRIAGYSRCAIYDDARKQFVSCKRVKNLSRQRMTSEQPTWEVAAMVRNSKAADTTAALNELRLGDIESKWANESYFREKRSLFGEALFKELQSTSKEVINKYDPEKPLMPGTEEWRALRADILRVLNGFIQGKILPNFDPDDTPGFRAFTLSDADALSMKSSAFRRLYLENEYGWIRPLDQAGTHRTVKLDEPGTGDDFTKDAENRSVRVVDLFPRQSSLNVNDLKLRSNTFSAKFLFNFLAGWGGGADYKRERERYSQFVQQELYASAFGKGGKEFGWTFNPMPGTDRLLSGVRTTYAIVIVPDDSSSIVLESRGCFFPRSSAQPNRFKDVSLNTRYRPEQAHCTGSKQFVVPIPNSGRSDVGFEVNAINYRQVDKNERAIVRILGKGFSSQIGVLINGVALTQSLGLGQPFIRDDSGVGKEIKTEISAAKVRGTFERIGETLIVATFEMEKDYQGTPTITLVAPSSAWELNSQEGLEVNGKVIQQFGSYFPNGRPDLTPQWPTMFGVEPPLSIDKVTVFPGTDRLRLVLTGKNLDKVQSVFVNGVERKRPPFAVPSPSPRPSPSPSPSPTRRAAQSASFFDRHLIALSDLPLFPKDKTLHITLLTYDGAVNASPIDNPAFEKRPEPPITYVFDETKLTISGKPTFEGCEESGETITALFAIKGKGFSEQTEVFSIDKNKKEEAQEFEFDTSTESGIRIKNPKPQTKLLFKDPGLKVKAQKVIVWKKPKDGC